MIKTNGDKAWEKLKELQGVGVVGYMGWCCQDKLLVFKFRLPANPEVWVGSLVELTAENGETLSELHCNALSHIAQTNMVDGKTKASVERIVAQMQSEHRRGEIQLLRVKKLHKIAEGMEILPERGLPKFRPLPQFLGLSPDTKQWGLFNEVAPIWRELGWSIWDLDENTTE